MGMEELRRAREDTAVNIPVEGFISKLERPKPLSDTDFLIQAMDIAKDYFATPERWSHGQGCHPNGG